jgi:hypothetical protein
MALALAASFAAGAGVTWAFMRARIMRKPFARARVVAPPHPAWLPPEPQPMPAAMRRSGGGGGNKDDGGGNSKTTPKWIEVDPSATPKAEVYALCISAVVPRPIALVSSVGPGAAAADVVDASGGGGNRESGPTTSTTPLNVAPYSYFNIVSHDPPTVAIGMCRSSARGGARKDSFANIEATG